MKNGIEKFQFHLLGHNFLVEMDMSSSPKMLQFKRKMLPIPSCLDGQIGFQSGLSKSGISKEKIIWLLTIFLENPQPLKDHIKTLTLEARSKKSSKSSMVTLNNITTIF